MEFSRKIISALAMFISVSAANQIEARCPELDGSTTSIVDHGDSERNNLNALFGLAGFDSTSGRIYLECQAAQGDSHALEQLLYAAFYCNLDFNVTTGLAILEQYSLQNNQLAADLLRQTKEHSWGWGYAPESIDLATSS